MDRKKQITDYFHISWIGLSRKYTENRIKKLEVELEHFRTHTKLIEQTNDEEFADLEKRIAELKDQAEFKRKKIQAYLQQKNELESRKHKEDIVVPEQSSILETTTTTPQPRLKLGDRLIAEGV